MFSTERLRLRERRGTGEEEAEIKKCKYPNDGSFAKKIFSCLLLFFLLSLNFCFFIYA